MITTTQENRNPETVAFTMIPNFILEVMPEMSGAESRVVLAICRKTYGWHKESDVISLSQFERLTGLSRQGVIDGLQAAMERGIVTRVKAGKSFAYSIVDNSPKSEQVINKASVDNSPRDRGAMVNEVDTQKKKDVTDDITIVADTTVVNNLAILTSINEEISSSGGATLDNLRPLAVKAATIGLDGAGLWSLWQACKATAKRPIGFFVYAINRDGKAPGDNKSKTVSAQVQQLRDEFREALA